jgi:Tol biopolymer transport system component/C-terminal processing protease CtpA/Prc
MRFKVVCIILCTIVSAAQAQTPTTLPSFAEPAISPDGAEIAFCSGGDIWTVPANGGIARLLVSHQATESRPVYSPDGKYLAFVSTRTGNGDVYLLNLDSGEVRRLTWDDGREELDGFSADGKWVYYSTTATDIGSSNHDIYRVSVEGGTPMAVIADRYANEFQAAPRPDGTCLAYCAGGIAAREWWRKGHAHGGESAVWLMRPGKPTFQQISPDGSRDLWPMWDPDGQRIYYVSDRDGTQNIVMRGVSDDPGTVGTALTHFKNGRVAWPSISRDGRTIVFERNFAIWKVSTAGADEEARSTIPVEVPIKLRGAIAGEAAEHHSYGSGISEMALSPDGKKIAFVVHGKAFAASARDGGEAVRINSAGSGLESHVTWAHDSKRLVYVSDRDGPRHLFLYDFSSGQEMRLTRGPDDDTSPRFSPDDAGLAFERNGSELRVVELGTRKERSLAMAQGFELAPFDRASAPLVWSPKGDWIAYTSIGPPRGFSNLYMVPADGSAKPRQVTFLANSFAHSVSWSPDGAYLLYGTGQRTEDYQLARIDLVPRTPHFREDQFRDLFRDGPRPMLPRPALPIPPDVRPAPATAPATAPVLASSRPAAATTRSGTTRIVFEDIRQRLTLLSVGVDVDFQAISPDGKTALIIGTSGGQQNLYTYALEDSGAVARQLTSNAGSKSHAQFSPDGREAYYLDNGRIYAIPLDSRVARQINVSAEMIVDFASEKFTVFRQAWTYFYDNFADAKFNGVDWIAVKDTYAPRIAGARTSDELRRILACMLGELNASHVGIYLPLSATRNTTGHLGLRFEREDFEQSGRLRVAEVFALGPAAVAGIKAGEFITAVDGRRIDKSANLDQMLDMKIGKRIVLRVGPAPGRTADFLARDVPLLPIDSASQKALMYKAWIESRRQIVDRASGGRLGYVHISDMTEAALARLNTDLDSETQLKQGVIVDVRGNSGGFVNGFAIDYLARRNYLTMGRRGLSFPIPSRVMLGQRALMSPTILVTNRSTYSDGEDFTEGYRALKLGKVVGEPTAGSVIFTNIVSLLDGTRMGLPSTKVFDGAGQELEGNPRPVDVAVARPSGEWYSGRDAQLEGAAAELLRQIDEGDQARKPISRPATRPAVADAPTDAPSSATRPESPPEALEAAPTKPREPR